MSSFIAQKLWSVLRANGFIESGLSPRQSINLSEEALSELKLADLFEVMIERREKMRRTPIEVVGPPISEDNLYDTMTILKSLSQVIGELDGQLSGVSAGSRAELRLELSKRGISGDGSSPYDTASLSDSFLEQTQLAELFDIMVCRRNRVFRLEPSRGELPTRSDYDEVVVIVDALKVVIEQLAKEI